MPPTDTARDERTHTDNPVGSASGISLFTTPIHGMLNGESVTLLGAADIVGKSPCFLYVTPAGVPQWESVQKFQITDSHVLPPNGDAFSRR